MKSKFLVGLFLLGLIGMSCGDSKETNTAGPAYPKEEVSEKQGQRKPFDDLVATYERPDRADWQKPMQVISYLGDDLKELIVAEIGAGTGYFTFRILPRVKKMIATDIDARMVAFMDSISQEYLPDTLRQRLDLRLALADNPNILPDKVDVIFLSNTYGFITNRVGYFSQLREALQPNGRLIIVDYKKRRIPVGPVTTYKVPLYKVEEELMQAGYSKIFSNDQLLPYQYIIVAIAD